MIYSILFATLATISALYWKRKYVPAQVARGAADFKRNGAADDLQVGYHSREFWRRVWPGLACCVVPPVPLAFVNWSATALGFGAMAALLLGIFIRDFTTKLNLARIANGETHLSEWYASGASKSWPDAKAWNRARLDNNLATYVQQSYANGYLKAIVLNAYRWCLLVAGLLGAGAVYLSI